MITYIVTKKNVFVPETEAYFAYDLGDALNMRDDLEHTTGESWLIAEVLDERNQLIRFIMWLHRKLK